MRNKAHCAHRKRTYSNNDAEKKELQKQQQQRKKMNGIATLYICQNLLKTTATPIYSRSNFLLLKYETQKKKTFFPHTLNIYGYGIICLRH